MPLDRNRPVQTREGRPVRIHTWTDGPKNAPIVGTMETSVGAIVGCWSKDGRWYGGGEGLYDVINAPPKKVVRWVNVCRVGGSEPAYWAIDSSTYEDEDSARRALAEGLTYTATHHIATCKIEWEE